MLTGELRAGESQVKQIILGLQDWSSPGKLEPVPRDVPPFGLVRTILTLKCSL